MRTKRLPRDVSVHLFRSGSRGMRFLMLKRSPDRGGFWQGVTGAPLEGETDAHAVAREVREETGYDVTSTLVDLGVSYSYRLRPDLAERWVHVYGPGVTAISVVAFAAEVPGGIDPVLDPLEHDEFRWCSYEEAVVLLDWPIEQDALHGRRDALRASASVADPAGVESSAPSKRSWR